MKRRVFNLLTGVSLVLCLATAVFGVRSYVVGDCLWVPNPLLAPTVDGRNTTYYEINLVSSVGRVQLCHWTTWRRPELHYFRPVDIGGRRVRTAEYLVQIPKVSSVLGFGWQSNPTSGDRAVIIPHWFVFIVFALLPAWRLGRWWTRSRRKHDGTCITCGYDLRATPERCPECGQAAVPAEQPGEST